MFRSRKTNQKQEKKGDEVFVTISFAFRPLLSIKRKYCLFLFTRLVQLKRSTLHSVNQNKTYSLVSSMQQWQIYFFRTLNKRFLKNLWIKIYVAFCAERRCSLELPLLWSLKWKSWYPGLLNIDFLSTSVLHREHYLTNNQTIEKLNISVAKALRTCTPCMPIFTIESFVCE